MALSANSPLPLEIGDFNELPADAVRIFEGSMCVIEPDGYVNTLQALATGSVFVGHAFAECNNSAGSAGDLNVKLRTGRYRMQVTITSVAITDVGKEVYASADATYTLTKGTNVRVGRVHRYVTTNTCVVEFQPAQLFTQQICGFAPELDCETLIDTADHVLIPTWMNQHGLIITQIWGVITEVMAGSSEDQGIITVYDEANNSLATLTASDAAADALTDIVMGYSLPAASTGALTKQVAAGKYVDCKVTQATSGGTPAGKMTVHILAVPLI